MITRVVIGFNGWNLYKHVNKDITEEEEMRTIIKETLEDRFNGDRKFLDLHTSNGVDLEIKMHDMKNDKELVAQLSVIKFR